MISLMKNLILLVLLGLAASLTRAATPPAQRPNVLLIAVDDLRDWVGYLGSGAHTPNLDRLAARSVVFTRSYCSAPVCNPSRAAIYFGRRPSTSGIYNNLNDGRIVAPVAHSLITQFRQAGYLTLGAGKNYHGGFDRVTDWEEYLPKERLGSADPEAITRSPKFTDGNLRWGPVDLPDSAFQDYKIAQFGIEHVSRKHDRPFFLSLGFIKPHLPWMVPRSYFELYPLEKLKLPPVRSDDLADVPPAGIKMAHGPAPDHAAILKAGLWPQAVQAALAAISFADAQIGRLLDALDAGPHREDTIVVLYSDHGWHMGEKEHWRKFALWEEATRSPLLWLVPGITPKGTRCERTVDFQSIYPTLLELCHLPRPAHVEGASIAPLLRDPSIPWDFPALTTFGRGNHAVRSERWRYIRYADGGEELYDHAVDPQEWNNLAKDPAHSEIIKALARHLPEEERAELPRVTNTPFPY